MMKAFRRRFIILNMSLIGIVLLTAFAVLGSFICMNEYAELKNTMSNVLKPWNAGNASVSESGEAEGGEEQEKEKPSMKPDGKKPEEKKDPAQPPRNSGYRKTESENRREHNNNITTLFYDKIGRTASVISETAVFEEDADVIANAVIDQADSFGTIEQYHIMYYREFTGSLYKIAVCDRSYIGSRIFRTILTLLIAYLLSMGVFLIISIRLAYFAEKPLRRSIEMERKFVADISHDLKTPITIIMANNSILKTNKESTISENMHWIESTDRASEDMMELIGKMLTMSAVDSQKQKIRTYPVSLTHEAERSLLQFESLAYEKNVILEDEIEEDLSVYATDEYLKRICSSLIENAFKYEKQGGKIIVRAYSRKHKAYFTVQNLNSRIDPEDLPHIFDRFYRGDKTRTLSKGHGLGLSIIRQMATLCGAEIEAVSSEKDGTIFTVTLKKA